VQNVVTGMKSSVDSIGSFAPISEVAKVPNVVLVNSKLGVNTLQDFIKIAKAAPGKYNFASTGVGGATHQAGESFKQAAGIDLVHVPYRGAGPALTALVGGEVEAYFGSVTGANSYVANKQITALAWLPAIGRRQCPVCRLQARSRTSNLRIQHLVWPARAGEYTSPNYREALRSGEGDHAITRGA
jgi:hypothetical protein